MKNNGFFSIFLKDFDLFLLGLKSLLFGGRGRVPRFF
ncbi:Putative protein [Zobellia galactanivorans]|uniref:Uncharacterized protein n=1 Tax=Zobellia galactanivorans (strain DSM 12802 / CCUG 47099 / CIP 106680 / NCIMB 13871 / Dsij) TaxID=63186 RepID=G0L2G5_ZOBGA|nr:Putative protein [Zobellia galactanivorans]